jgi:hypothetical protein
VAAISAPLLGVGDNGGWRFDEAGWQRARGARRDQRGVGTEAITKAGDGKVSSGGTAGDMAQRALCSKCFAAVAEGEESGEHRAGEGL